MLASSHQACAVDGCTKAARRAGRCWAHAKRKYTYGIASPEAAAPLLERAATPLQGLTEGALAYADAEEDEAFAQALDRLRRAAVRYVQSLPSAQLRPPMAARHRTAHAEDSHQLWLPGLSQSSGMPAHQHAA